jgi:5-methylcytosine-specific restriction protein A
MPWMTPRPCRHPGCGVLIRGRGTSRCEQHRPEERKRQDERRPSAARRGYGPEWRELRAQHLRDHPECVVCGEIDPRNEVDHKIPISQGGARLDPANLQTMCKTHHSVKTGRYDRGAVRARA